MSKILVKEGDKEEINGEISGEIGERAKDFEDGAINAPIPDIFFRVGIPLSILYYRTGSTKLVRDRMYTRVGFVFYTNAGEESRESVQLETKHCLERFIILETFLTERIKFTLVNHEYEDLQFV